MKQLRLLFVAMLAVATPVSCTATVINFNEFGTSSPIDANGVHLAGVTFIFGPAQADYNGMIGTTGNTVFLTDPVLTGSTDGMLTLIFDYPTSVLQFDIALQSLSPIDDTNSGPNGGPAYVVTLSTGSVLNGATAPQPAGFYSEGEFQYSGPAITSASLTFFNGTDAAGGQVGAFGLDNLVFNSPEPGSTSLLACGLIALGLIRRQRARTR
jgi:hypothetical protein